MASPLENLSGPGKLLAAEPPDAEEFAGLKRSGLVRLKDAENPANDGAVALLDGFRHVEVASVSDALEKLSGHKMYMSHRMRPIFGSKFAGFALTVQLKKEPNNDPHALDGMLAAIDQGGANSVYIMAVEDGIDIAGMGGLMGTAMSARGFSGAVIDGGVRDVAYNPVDLDEDPPHVIGNKAVLPLQQL